MRAGRLSGALLCFTALLVAGCGAGSPRFTTKDRVEPPAREPAGPPQLEGIASYYADEFQGRKTASGEVYDMNDLTAAHRTLPFGTKVRVTNKETGKSVVVRINDRGPFKEDRVIDLSLGAARQLGLIASGTASVVLQVLEWGTQTK
ncbi:MAG TPA: septal ring lytic transglycosylase RlpA family protein [Bacteroidota bacterium]|nr:septal ring lytic transglycosylase RlpA family protein [Bacteroidota bacterium]